MWFVRIPRGRFRPMAARMAELFGLDQNRGPSKEQALRGALDVLVRTAPCGFTDADEGNE